MSINLPGQLDELEEKQYQIVLSGNIMKTLDFYKRKGGIKDYTNDTAFASFSFSPRLMLAGSV